MIDATNTEISGADWPTFGWIDDVRPALTAALEAGRAVSLATLYRVEGSAPRGPGAQMLFDGPQASGYFSGDCIEGDVASHAAQVLSDGIPRRLHYGMGSPWIDIRLRCGGALHVLVERVAADSSAAATLIAHARNRTLCTWISDGDQQEVRTDRANLPIFTEAPFRLARRYYPPRRLIVSGGDPGALALAQLGMSAQFETILVRPNGPESPPPFPVSQYIRAEPGDALPDLRIDRWTAYIGATHEDHHDLAGVLYALRHGAGYTGMIGAQSRAQARLEALRAAGASDDELAALTMTPGVRGLGKAPWQVATGILAQVMQVLNRSQELE